MVNGKKLSENLVLDLGPSNNNPRNSEGSFLRAKDGAILFAYSRYTGDDWNDHCSCDIALVKSYDEGETWSEPEIIVKAEDFCVNNVMSVSGMTNLDGSLSFYFIIKENNFTTTIARAVSEDGINFKAERCNMQGFKAYYVFNNDRIERLSNGNLVFPAAMVAVSQDGEAWEGDHNYTSVVFESTDDGKSFTLLKPRINLSFTRNVRTGMQEPGVYEHKNGVIRLWARTDVGYQYECFSIDNLKSFTSPEPSDFTSPCSPMEWVKAPDGVLYAVYNPIPNYNSRLTKNSWGRTPLVIRKSLDDGMTFGVMNVIEDDENRGYCYPAMFFTNDGSVLVSYCRGGYEEKACLVRVGINKIKLSEIE